MESAGEALLRQGIERGIEQGMQLGDERGFERGRKQGIAEGEANGLVRLLERRFGTLPESLRSRISSASLEQLERWSDSFLDAHSLTDLFGVSDAP